MGDFFSHGEGGFPEGDEVTKLAVLYNYKGRTHTCTREKNKKPRVE